MSLSYEELQLQLSGLLEGERDPWANMANAAALLWQALPGLNWAGFYLWRDEQLIVGPFQGKPACVRIALGQGVCGTSAERRETIVVQDVHAFPGHIPCDAASNSEIVVPMVLGETLLGVLDLDSPSHGRFTTEDAAGLEKFARRLVAGCDWELLGSR